ncbi:hypothetical protein ABE137_00445 [Brevibacillus laterosporus]|uniref:Uncharacterized protein n=1 Tax=Brevibacillus halotolerans TaxID=1507437 RepID=A0ABT4HUT7_9BACL|nr:hypothetical protein [Brevibacillus halotolerans]MCZ0830558.1 hypothetical protein [Brevibacillus halotolerans]
MKKLVHLMFTNKFGFHDRCSIIAVVIFITNLILELFVRNQEQPILYWQTRLFFKMIYPLLITNTVPLKLLNYF